jgi:NADPH:quinone reductase-like Zn-dependent oxidoreductase
LPASTVFATEVEGWKDRVTAAAEGAKIHVALDSVGGRLLGNVADLLAQRTGTVINGRQPMGAFRHVCMTKSDRDQIDSCIRDVLAEPVG